MAVDASGPARTYLTIPHAAAAADQGPPRLEPIGVGALGRVEPASSVRRIGPPGTLAVNRLHRLMVTDGQDVTEGELLAEFDAESSHKTHPESAGFFSKMKEFFEGLSGQ